MKHRGSKRSENDYKNIVFLGVLNSLLMRENIGCGQKKTRKNINKKKNPVKILIFFWLAVTRLVLKSVMVSMLLYVLQVASPKKNRRLNMLIEFHL